MTSNDLFCCPLCKGSLLKNRTSLVCKKCKTNYKIVQGIPVLLKESSLTDYAIGQIDYFTESVNKPPIFIAWMDTFMKRIYLNLPFKKTSVILDLATGDGYCALKLAQKGYNVIALDFTFETLLQLREKAKRLKIEKKIQLVCADATQLPLKDKKVDIIIANAILEHIHKEKTAIKEIDRVCKKNSGLMVVVPLAYKYIWPFFIPVNYYHDKDIGHLRRYSEKDFRSKFKSWKIKQIYYTGHLIKVTLFLIAYVSKWRSLDKPAERSDEFFANRPYGASNITVFLTKVK